jgi:alcohol dehydrogenase class IV
MSGFSFNTVTQVVVSSGAAGDLGGYCRQLDMRRVLLVTDPGLVAAGLIAPVTDALKESLDALVVFDRVTADPADSVVTEAADIARETAVDGVIAVGGGSSMDVAKVVSVLLKGTQSLASMYGVDQVQGDRLPLILVPTTAGTGSEVTPVAVITTGATTKAGVSSRVLFPDIAVLDAELTVGLPLAVTAMTGIDAMVHAIEAYTSRLKKNPLSDMLAQRALKLLSHHLRRVLEDPTDLKAREAMLLGSMMAGQAFANAPVGAVHALAYPLGGHYHIPHGLSNSLMLPTVLAFNAREAEHHYADLCQSLPGNIPPSSVSFIDWLVALIADSGLPATLSEAQVPEKDLAMLAADAMQQQRLLVNNPVPVEEADALQLYQTAWGAH